MRSSLPLADAFDEWVILDHRSTDDTPAMIDGLRPLLTSHRIKLTVLHEARDFSATHTFADVRTRTIQACANDLVVLHDADFLLGPAFRSFLAKARTALLAPASPYYGATYAIPVIWDRMKTDRAGFILDHGRVWVHPRRPRIFRRDRVHYQQTGDGGRWERIVVTGAAREPFHLTRRTAPARGAVVSINVKPPARIALRQTMTMFMQDAMQGKVSGDWLDHFARGTTREQPAYPYVKMDLSGWHLHAPALDLAA